MLFIPVIISSGLIECCWRGLCIFPEWWIQALLCCCRAVFVFLFFLFVYDCRSHKDDTTAACTGQAGYSFTALCFWCELLVVVVIPINYEARSKQYKKVWWKNFDQKCSATAMFLFQNSTSLFCCVLWRYCYTSNVFLMHLWLVEVWFLVCNCLF